jgi:hypothetical protein
VDARHAASNTARASAAASARSWARGRLLAAILPELRAIAPEQQSAALHAARDTPLDLLELIGMAAGLVVVTAITRYVLVDASFATRLMATLADFAVALPLLALALGPFHARRLRRGLRAQLQRRNRP